MPERTNLVNALDVSLSAELLAGATSMNVIGATDIPDAPFYVVVDPFSTTLREYMLCTAVSGTGDARTLTVTRNEDGSIGDVDHAAGNLCRFATVAQHVSDLWDQVELVQSERVRWLNRYDVDVTYERNDMVLDLEWTMIANQQTDERAAPQPIGEAGFVYEGPVTTNNPTSKQIVHGTKYTFSADGYLTGYRVYVVTGNTYTVFASLNNRDLTQVVSFEASNTGWINFPIAPNIFPTGTIFALVSVISEPDATPTTFNGDWAYLTPNNETVPLPGQITQATRLVNEIWISKTDDNAGDRGAELLALTPGDIIDGAGVRWSIGSLTDEGSYVVFAVAPAIQGVSGTQNFIFETTTATPITHQANTDWWLTNQPSFAAVKGLFSDGGGLGDMVEDDTAYGTDIQLQGASVSTHWDVVAFSQ